MNAERRVIVLTTRERVMSKLVGRFLKDNSGATAIEYALIAAGISIVILAAVNSIATTLNATFTSVSTALK
jgi:pilus assembly protein Flp/PilA